MIFHSKLRFWILFLTVVIGLTLGICLYFLLVYHASPVIHVPTDHPTIQEGVNNAGSDGTILVHSGVYYENVVLNKSVMLLGEDVATTIIDGNLSGNVFEVEHGNVTISGFTIQNSGLEPKDSGIILHSNGNIIIGNTIANNWGGISLLGSNYNTVTGNNIINNVHGIRLEDAISNSLFDNIIRSNIEGVLFHGSNHNAIYENVIEHNYEGVLLGVLPSNRNNTFYHNAFANNTNNAYVGTSDNFWDNGYPSGGNYWSDYAGFDLYTGPWQNVYGSDNIGDTPYIVQVLQGTYTITDNYPLVKPWKPEC